MQLVLNAALRGRHKFTASDHLRPKIPVETDVKGGRVCMRERLSE